MGPFIEPMTLNTLDQMESADTYRGGFSSYTIPQRMVDLSIFLVENDSYFSTCERDDKGRCTSGGGSEKSTSKEVGKGSNEGIDIEARPVEGAGKAGGVGTATKGGDVATKGLGKIDKWLAGESKPSSPPGPVGKLMASLTQKFGHLEHAAVAIAKTSAQYVKDKVADSTARLPGPLQKLANAAFVGLRVGAGTARAGAMLGVKAGFSYWTGISKIAENVASRKGATPDQAKKISTALAGMDMKALEVAKGGAILSMIPGLGHALHFTHGLAQITATIPVATTAYLATNSVAHPVATAKGAWDSIKQLGSAVGGIAAHPVKTAKAVGKYAASEFKKGYNIGGIKAAPTKASQQAAQAQAARDRASGVKPKTAHDLVHHRRYSTPVYLDDVGESISYFSAFISNAEDTPPDPKQVESVTNLVADALEAHDYDDWYLALFCAALDAGQKVQEAIDSANAAYDANPEGPGEGSEEEDNQAMQDLYGDLISQLGLDKEAA